MKVPFKNLCMERKGQVEMIGLVIVVLLIVVGGLFYVKFMMISDTNKPNIASHEDSIKANNLMGAIANVELCEGEYTVGEMFSMIGGLNGCGDKTADSYLMEEIPLIFEAVGVENYRFWVEEAGNVIFDTEGCEYGLKSGSYALVVDGRYFKTHLRFCSESSTEE